MRTDADRLKDRERYRREAEKRCAYQHAYRLKNSAELRDKQKEHRKKKPEVYLNSRLKSQYGLSLAEYQELLESQGGVCKICKQPCNSGKRLAVDHCHLTGKIRGLLCTCCNTGIGKFRDSPELLLAAVEYLKNAHN